MDGIRHFSYAEPSTDMTPEQVVWANMISDIGFAPGFDGDGQSNVKIFRIKRQ
jgi:hypothetical protein